MTPLLEQFLSESRESLQSIGALLMQLEKEPGSSELITDLFRFVHTLKGNSGLFDYPELTRVLHACEDLMDAVRCGQVTYSPAMADRLLDAMDFVSILCDEIESSETIHSSRSGDSFRLAEMLRAIITDLGCQSDDASCAATTPSASTDSRQSEELDTLVLGLSRVPEALRMDSFREAVYGMGVYWLKYCPAEDCFFQGEDPFFQSRQTPGLLWGRVTPRNPWPQLTDLDAYRCRLDFEMLSAAGIDELDDFFRYVTDQVRIDDVPKEALIIPQGDLNDGAVHEDFLVDAFRCLEEGNFQGLSLAVQSMQELLSPDLWISSALRWIALVVDVLGPEGRACIEAILQAMRSYSLPDWQGILPPAGQTEDTAEAPAETTDDEGSVVIAAIVAAQHDILSCADDDPWLLGRLRGVAAALSGCLHGGDQNESRAALLRATESAICEGTSSPLREWLEQTFPRVLDRSSDLHGDAAPSSQPSAPKPSASSTLPPAVSATPSVSSGDPEVKFGRRADDAVVGAKVLKVDQAKIERLMNLIGEMVVAKNALPYLAGRAESVYGTRDLSREIKTQYAVINRIAEEMQDSIMQVRMMPMSFIFQRFPRLVRDISHRLGKDVNLVLEGEETEADKMIVEALGDPLVHIVRNSLDHGIEQPEIRRAQGKPAQGTLTIRASQESDKVVITVKDDGKGLDPEVLKHKAYEKGLLDEDRMERMSDQDAIHLIFAPGFSTADAVSDLSGRGVGMDVVRAAVEKVNGTILLESRKGEGTCLRLSLPLSMAVTNAMIIESDGQIFGVPMDTVVETVRVRSSDIRSVKNVQTMILRGRIVPIKGLNSVLGLSAPPKVNDDGEYAVLVISHGEEPVGILVDNFRESVDIILKPMSGVLTGLTVYSGSALLGDGSVLMVLNFKELL